MGALTKLRRNRRALYRTLIIIGLIAAFLAAALIYLGTNMREAMTALAIARIRSTASRAMNDAILDTTIQDDGYSELLQVRENGSKVYMVQADPRRMNLIGTQCAEAAQERIAELGEQGISIPLGTITGIAFLSGRGPLIRVSFTPAGSVQSQFSSEFTSSGINQTLYRVNLKLTANVRLVMPSVSESISVSAEAVIAENIIAGEVPQVYTNVDNEEDMLNLVPTDIP